MGVVVHFPTRPRLICSEITEAQAEEVQSILSQVLDACPACKGRGVFLFKHRVTGLPQPEVCPCGGADGERIELPEVM